MKSFPVSFRVICVGEELSGVFRPIFSMGFDGVLVQSTTMFPNPTPSEEDKMVILLTNGRSPLLESIAKSFYQAGVLTLVVSTSLIETKETICDAQTVTSMKSMPLIVKRLFAPLFSDQLTCYDYNDLCDTLHKTGRFKAIEASSQLNDHRIEDAITKISGMIGPDDFNHVEKVSFIIFINRGLQPQLEISEMQTLSEYVHKLPEEVDVLWSVNYDNNISTNEVRLEAILSGKNLELLCNDLQKHISS